MRFNEILQLYEEVNPLNHAGIFVMDNEVEPPLKLFPLWYTPFMFQSKLNYRSCGGQRDIVFRSGQLREHAPLPE